MAHLTDMEELLARIEAPLIKDYMREAMNCYMACAYRGCIVLSYVALFDDLLDKLAELGKVNSTAKGIHVDASQKKSDQEVFETYLIDQLSSESLLSGLDSAFLNILRIIRNKSAHPSGHAPSPEEARFVFFEVIDRFLSQPILSTTQLVEEIIGRLANTHFFPTSVISDVSEVVAEEIASLHEGALPQLIEKLSAAVISTDKTIAKNGSHFIVGMSRLGVSEINKQIRERIVKKKSDDQEYSTLILRLLSANPELVGSLSNAYIKRIKKIIGDRIAKIKASDNETRFSHPATVLTALAGSLSEEEMEKSFGDEARQLIQKRPYSEYLLSGIKTHEKLVQSYVAQLLENAGSSQFVTANAFAGAIEDLDDPLSEVVDNETAFRLLVRVIEAAEWGAFGSKALVSSKFSDLPKLRSMALKHASTKKRAAKDHFQSALGLSCKLSEFSEKYMEPEGGA